MACVSSRELRSAACATEFMSNATTSAEKSSGSAEREVAKCRSSHELNPGTPSTGDR